MREVLLLSTPWSQVRKLRLRRIRNLVKIIQPITDRKIYWYLSSGCQALGRPICALPWDIRQRRRGKGQSQGWGAGHGGGRSSKRQTEERRELLTSKGRVSDHLHMSWRLWAMGSWDIRAGEISQDTPTFEGGD